MQVTSHCTDICINTYIHTYICTFQESVSLSQRQYDVERVINTQIHTLYSVKCCKQFTKQYRRSPTQIKNSST